MIGEYTRLNGNTYNVMTKLGLKDYREFNSRSLVIKFEKTLESLSRNSVQTLFLHSVPYKYFSEDLLSGLLKLKSEESVERIGYSGDNEDLDFAIRSECFDDFMVSMNLLDMSNITSLEKMSTEKMLYVKRPLANAVWKNWHFNICKFHFYRTLGARRTQDTHNYFFRYKIRRKSLPDTSELPQSFLKFVASIPINKTIVIGTTDLDHLKLANSLLSNPFFIDTKYFSENLEKWKEDNKFQWRAMR